MLFLGIISWNGASHFNGDGGGEGICFSDGGGFIFKWGVRPMGGGALALMGGGFQKKS